MYNPAGIRGILKTTRENVKNVGRVKKRVRFNLPDKVSNQEEQPLRMLDKNSSGGKRPMEEARNSNALGSTTPEASLQEKMGKIYEKSRSYWDSTIKDYEAHRSYRAKGDACDQTQKATDTLKTLAYIKLGEEIMKQDDLLKFLGRNGTETQLTKIRDGELYAFEKGGQLHITSNKDDVGANKAISLNDAVDRIDRGGIDKVKWHLPKVYAIKVETEGPEPKVLITDNEELVKKSRGEGGQALPGTKIEVDFPGIVSSDQIEHSVVVKPTDSVKSGQKTLADQVEDKQMHGQKAKNREGIVVSVSEPVQVAKAIETKGAHPSHQEGENSANHRKSKDAKREWGNKEANERDKILKQLDANFEQVNIPGDNLNCLLYAVLRAYGYDPYTQKKEVDAMIKPVRVDIDRNLGEQRGSMLDLADGSGMAAIGMLRHQQKLDTDRGIVVRVQDSNGRKWVWEAIPSTNGKAPIYLHLQNAHFQALIPKKSSSQ